jgi:hypothetical protein
MNESQNPKSLSRQKIQKSGSGARAPAKPQGTKSSHEKRGVTGMEFWNFQPILKSN